VSDLARLINLRCGLLVPARALFVLNSCAQAICPASPQCEPLREDTDIGGYLCVRRNPLCALVNALCQHCPGANFLLMSAHSTPLVGKFEYLSRVRGTSQGAGKPVLHRELRETVIQL
jgi:hypothetical protein